MLEEWAYRRLYHSNAARDRALQPWVHRYSHHRAHTALGGRHQSAASTTSPITTYRALGEVWGNEDNRWNWELLLRV